MIAKTSDLGTLERNPTARRTASNVSAGIGGVRVAVVGGVSWPQAARSRMRAAKKT